MNSKLLSLALALLIFTVCASAQQQSKDIWARYTPSTLARIVKAHPGTVAGSGKGAGTDLEPVRARVTYTGTSRPIAISKQRLISAYMETNGTPQFANKFPTEWLFIENGVEFWLPVQDVLIPYFGKELHKGDSVELFVELIGITQPEHDGRRMHVFVVNEFNRLESKQVDELTRAQWYAITGPEKDFTLEFPTQPRRDNDLIDHGVLVRGYSWSSGYVWFSMTFNDTGVAPNSRDGNEFAEDFVLMQMRHAQEDGEGVIHARLLSKNVFEKEKWFPSKQTKLYFHGIERTVLHKGQLYGMLCSSLISGQEVNAQICHRFLNSFRLIATPQ